MDDKLATLIADLRQATTFQRAAAATLLPMLRTAAAELSASPFAKDGKIVRGMIHLRPQDEYRQIVTLSLKTPRAAGAADDWVLDHEPTSMPAATAWRWLAEHKCSVSVDVALGKVQPHAADSQVIWDRAMMGGAFNTEQSSQRFVDRGVTHVHVLPLRTPGGAIHGMISIEADCRLAGGRDFIWARCLDRLELFCEIAAPYLVGLPVEAAPRPSPDDFLPVVGKSMASLIEMLRVFAHQEETILIAGPTGSGKSRLARWCHHQSPRRKGRFESIDLNTVPEELQVGELFGWKKGAFTGAVKDNPGCVARAEGGTLFVDEIDKLSLKAQARLLYLLEERSYRSLGEGAGERHADVRFIIGTNADLPRLAQIGEFRSDLYYRINVLPVKVPPLSARQDEIVAWANYMIERRHHEGVPDGSARIAPEAERVLLRSSWPGNLRQLDNIVRRSYSLALLEHGRPPRDLWLTAAHVERALAYEAGEARPPLVELLQSAAAAFVSAATRVESDGKKLDLDLAESFRGFVLASAVTAVGNKDEAFRLLGKEPLVKNRNHHKAFKRELQRVASLLEAVGEPLGSPFTEMMDGEDE